jgi:hypothetical protein
MTSKRALSLSRSQRLLAALIPGRAPSLSTLQRHATAGDLVACEADRRGKRILYDPDKLRDRYRDWVEAGPAAQRARGVGAAGEGALVRHEYIEQLAGLIAAPLVARVEQLSKDVAALNGLRASLMQKYDAAAALSLDRAERLAQQLADTRKLVDLDMRIARLAAEVSKFSELLRGHSGSAQ